MKHPLRQTIFDDIILLHTSDIPETDIPALLRPIQEGAADAVFGLGQGKVGSTDRLLTFASNVLTGARLSSMTHVCCAVRKEAFDKITITETAAGITAELVAKLTDRHYKVTEVPVSLPKKRYANMFHALVAILIHCPLITYGFVGLVSTLIEWALFWLCDNFTGMGIAVSTAISFVLSTVANWFMGRAWTFKAHAGSYSDILPVCIVSAIGLGLSEALMWLFTSPFDMPNFLSKVICTMLVFFWNYLARKKIVYRHK